MTSDFFQAIEHSSAQLLIDVQEALGTTTGGTFLVEHARKCKAALDAVEHIHHVVQANLNTQHGSIHTNNKSSS